MLNALLCALRIDQRIFQRDCAQTAALPLSKAEGWGVGDGTERLAASTIRRCSPATSIVRVRGRNTATGFRRLLGLRNSRRVRPVFATIHQR